MLDKDTYYRLGRKLEKTEVKELFEELKTAKNQDIRDILVEEHLYIAEILAKKYTNRGIDFEDIFQVASIGLIYAIDRFDASKGFEFSSFATPTIIGEIKKYFRDKGWTIRVPRRIQELSKKINNAKTQLAQQLQRSPSVADIANYLDVAPEDVLEAMEASKVYAPQSLDVVYESGSDDKEINLADIIGENDATYEKIENNDFIRQAMAKLNEVEQTIIIERYFNKKTQVSIANELKISQMTVSRIEKKVLEKLRKEIERTMID